VSLFIPVHIQGSEILDYVLLMSLPFKNCLDKKTIIHDKEFTESFLT